MMATTKKHSRGFTLIELLVVLAIISMLAAIVVPNVMKHIRKGKMVKALADVQGIETATNTYILNDGIFRSMYKYVHPTGPTQADGKELDRLVKFLQENARELPRGVGLDPWGNRYMVVLKEPSNSSYPQYREPGLAGTEDELAPTNAGGNGHFLYMQPINPDAKRRVGGYYDSPNGIEFGRPIADDPLTPTVDESKSFPRFTDQGVKVNIIDVGSMDNDANFIPYRAPKGLDVYIWSRGENGKNEFGAGDDICTWDGTQGWAGRYTDQDFS